MLSRMNLSITLKSEPGKYRAYCTGFVDGCKWRIYVSSTIGDHTTVQVKKNPFPHVCHSTRRSGNVKGATKFWICEKIKGWLAEDPNVGPIELQRRPKEHYKVSITYKRVYDGRQLAMEELYDGDPNDIAAMLAERGPPKGRKKKIAPATTETSIVSTAPAQRMVFPVLPIVADLSKKRKNKSFSSTGAKKQKSTSTPEAGDPSVTGSATGSNQLDPLAITYPSRSSDQHMADKSTRQQQHKKKKTIKEKLTPNKASPAMSTRSKVPSSPSSRAMGTRRNKKLDL